MIVEMSNNDQEVPGIFVTIQKKQENRRRFRLRVSKVGSRRFSYERSRSSQGREPIDPSRIARQSLGIAIRGSAIALRRLVVRQLLAQLLRLFQMTLRHLFCLSERLSQFGRGMLLVNLQSGESLSVHDRLLTHECLVELGAT